MSRARVSGCQCEYQWVSVSVSVSVSGCACEWVRVLWVPRKPHARTQAMRLFMAHGYLATGTFSFNVTPCV